MRPIIFYNALRPRKEIEYFVVKLNILYSSLSCFVLQSTVLLFSVSVGEQTAVRHAEGVLQFLKGCEG